MSEKQEEDGVSPWRRRIKRGLMAVGIAIGGAFVVFAVAWVLTPIPDKAQANAEAIGSVFYYRDGKTVLGREGVDRTPVSLAKVPEHVRAAVLASEDRNFYKESGVSIRGSLRAFWSTITGQQTQGGSTVTQQMVRNYYDGLSQERTATRKLKEIIVALKVDREKSKDWILEQYLNTIYFGRGAYGIQAAAKAYYDKDISELSPAEGAYLAGVIQQPSRFAQPYGKARAAAEARWQGIVDTMGLEDQSFPVPIKQKVKRQEAGQTGYMLQAARAELRSRGYTDKDIETGGMKVVTTFDKKLMAAAKEAVTDALPKGTSKKVQVGMASVDPDTGEVVAFYGGRDYLEDQWDNAFRSRPQTGSGFKPYVLAAALEDGKTLSSGVDGGSPMTIGDDKVRNNGGSSYGRLNLVEATRKSVNTAYVRLGQDVGLDKVVDAAEAAGLPASAFPEKIASAPTLSIGIAGASAVQQASGFGTFAADGTHRGVHVLRSVDGQKTSVPRKRAFDRETTRDVSYALQQVVRSGTGTAARLPDGRPVAGKTGTTDEGKAIWFTGYAPQLSTSVAIFRDDNKPLSIPGYGDVYGGQLPATMWRGYMTTAMEGRDIERFENPSPRRSDDDTEPAPRPTVTRRPPPSTGPSEPSEPPDTPEPPDPPKPTDDWPPDDDDPPGPTVGPPDPTGKDNR